MGTKLSLNTIYHPQTDGQIERVIGVLNQYLKNYVNTNQKDWGKHLSLVKFCYNSTMHSTTKMSAIFELALGKKVRKPMDLAIPMGQRDHSKEAMEMVKGCEKLYA